MRPLDYLRNETEPPAARSRQANAPHPSSCWRFFEKLAEQAITRSFDGIGVANPKVINPEEKLDIHSILRAYTINGAKAMSQSDDLGSLEVGKKADFIVISQNLVELAEQGKANSISETTVLNTWFDGNLVYSR